jgi:signal transduction histidine kinase
LRAYGQKLHDDVSQTHAMITLNLGKIQVEALGDNNKATIAKCKKLTEEVSRELSAIYCLLHPPLLEEPGFESAFKIDTGGFAQRTGILVYVDVEADRSEVSLNGPYCVRHWSHRIF